MRATLLSLPEGSTRSRSPERTVPLAIMPAKQGRDRNGDDGFEPDLAGESAVVLENGVEDFLIEADHVHLVDGEHDVPNADEGDEIAVPARLCQNALVG